MAKRKVIDISEFQPDNIDWKKIKDTGYWVILRIGIRGSVKKNAQYYGKIRFDFKFHMFLAAVKKYGIPYSIYFFPAGINDEESREEADWIIRQIRDLAIELSMPVYLDSELVDDGNGRADRLSETQRTRFLKIICDALWAAGIPCGIYASRSWFYEKLIMSRFDQRTLENTWCAQYADKCDYTGLYAMWQYTSKAKISGIPTAPGKGVDVSIITGTFNMGSGSVKKVEADKEEKKETKFIHSRSAIVSEAISHIGVKEGSVLHHKIIDRYNARKPLPRGYAVKYTDPWCATFVSYLAIVMGYTDIIPVECGCPQMIELAKKMGIWVEDDSYVPKPGDIPLYDWQDSGRGDNTGTPDHIGIAEKVVNGKTTVIEGNYKDAVGRREIAVNGRYIRGYIVPKYDDEEDAETQKQEEKPASEPAVDVAHTVEYYAIVNTKTDPLNVRIGPGTGYKQCSFSPIPKGAKIGVCYHKVGEWYLVKYGGKYGYVHSKYLKRI